MAKRSDPEAWKRTVPPGYDKSKPGLVRYWGFCLSFEFTTEGLDRAEVSKAVAVMMEDLKPHGVQQHLYLAAELITDSDEPVRADRIRELVLAQADVIQQEKLAESTDKLSRRANILGIVAIGLAVVQIWIAVRDPRPVVVERIVSPVQFEQPQNK